MSVPAALLRNSRPSPHGRALLPWEDEAAFEELQDAWFAEHQPEGPTEASLVDQLVWCDWRRRRLMLGERAAHLAAAEGRQAEPYQASQTLARALIATAETAEPDELAAALQPEDGEETLADVDADEAMTRRAIALLETGDPEAYAEALATLRGDTQDWWEDIVSDDEETHPDGQPVPGDAYQPHTRSTASLLRFLTEDVLPFLARQRTEIARRPAIRLQVEGESLDPWRMDKILALDERLTRQFEKALAMLVRLKEMRAASAAGARR